MAQLSTNATIRKYVSLRVALIGALVIALAGSAYYVLEHWPQRGGSYPASAFEVPQGASLNQIATELERRGVIENRLLFSLYARLHDLDRGLQAGNYQLPANLSAAELLAFLSSGKVEQHAIRLPEGLNMRTVMALLANEAALSHQSTGLAGLADELDLQLPFVEGAFFPETYFVPQGASDLSVLQRAHDAMIEHLTKAWQNRGPNLGLDSPEQALVLASIIEKESDGLSDRAQISQVFHLRLKKNMKLQTDPTVIYALGQSFDGDIRRRDLRVDSPFNTYRYRGLPPTPIALPSLASIEAALHPAAGDYLYFVARGDGSSQFSRTLKEHNAAVRRYQLSKGGS
jgi:UPF0755 protein